MEDDWAREYEALDLKQEQGTVRKYTPTLTLESLRGYGPAVASDSALGRVETALRAMRIMAGSRPFNSTSSFAHDVHDDWQTYAAEKKPLFFDTMEEREWVQQYGPGRLKRLQPPSDVTKKAILHVTIAGKYDAPKFAEVGDTETMMAKYHAREGTYTLSDGKAFDEKVLSLLPRTAQAGRQPAVDEKTA